MTAHVVVGLATPVFGCPRCRGAGYAGLRLPVSSWGSVNASGGCGVGFVDAAVVVNWRGSVEDGRGLLLVSGGLGEVKTSENETRRKSCLISRHTFWASQFLGPPWIPPPVPSSSRVKPAHIPMKRGGAWCGWMSTIWDKWVGESACGGVG